MPPQDSSGPLRKWASAPNCCCCGVGSRWRTLLAHAAGAPPPRPSGPPTGPQDLQRTPARAPIHDGVLRHATLIWGLSAPASARGQWPPAVVAAAGAATAPAAAALHAGAWTCLVRPHPLSPAICHTGLSPHASQHAPCTPQFRLNLGARGRRSADPATRLQVGSAICCAIGPAWPLGPHARGVAAVGPPMPKSRPPAR